LLRSCLSIAVIGFIFRVIEKFVRTKLWKYAYPELDFSGKWVGKTIYDVMQIASFEKTPKDHKVFFINHEIIFIQDCLSISIGPTVADHYSGGWKSYAATLGNSDIQYAYCVRYNASDLFPSEAFGFERLNVIDPKDGNPPVKMSGSFAHCAWGQTPVYSGTVSFERNIARGSTSLLHRLVCFVMIVLAKLTKPRVD
jgi:hypothetical protein